jgi:beta-glucosidase
MSKRLQAALAAVSVLALTGASVARQPQGLAKKAAVQKDARARAAAIVAKMTLDEKIGLVHGLFPPFAKGKTKNELIPSAGYIDGVPRLGVPLRARERRLARRRQPGRAAQGRCGDRAAVEPRHRGDFDPEIARIGGAMIGAEARAKRFNVLLAGGVNLTRDPWNGRNFEYLGEDPLLAGAMAGAAVAGRPVEHIVSTVKHFA